RSFISKLIKDNLVYVNESLITKPGYLIKQNDLITVHEKQENINETNNNLEIRFEIIYEDEYLMVINKPKNLLCHKTKFNETDTLVDELKQYYLNKNYCLNNLKDLRNGLVHRLDKDTNGLLLVAKNIDVFNSLKNDLENNKIQKLYYAIVKNNFDNDLKEFTINLPLDHIKDSIKVKVDKNGKEAITKIKVLKNFKNYSFIECNLLTGRTHQIRVHLSAINHPILNDPLYNTDPVEDDTYQYLIAYKLQFIHPVTKKLMQFEIELTDLFKNKMKILQKL
ncbi:RluA family pseudouridine synthase, partial [bacterium]|nr:RluA family pseudouridine synthase [bacterium]